MKTSTLTIRSEQLLKRNNVCEEGEHGSTPTDGMDKNNTQQKVNNRPTLGVRPTQTVSRRDTIQKNICSKEAIRTHTAVKKEEVKGVKGDLQGLKTNTCVHSKRIPLGKNERVKAALNWLCTTFPSLFNTADRLPLKLGIMHDITMWLAVQSNAENVLRESDTGAHVPAIFPTKKAIRDALSVYTHSQQYQKSLLEKDKRYDLNGSEVGVVEAYQKDYANQQNAARKDAIHVRKVKHKALKERRKQHASMLHEEKKNNEE